ncbi:nucleotidyltransferase domain-containing protein [Kaustia mangrovi]|uniref:Nucleotidyltransferase domain-containing protein n=1 Tax=Kaustia mangrovi TaxID=2593653 RepID=A0A7S8C1I3_9HYPH|nr:nucleotidyltransferase domain-containing protein [Kaustia mangrovi]QPC41659.1 nucleotidyltransferase domain-containing protein [Kaustia mangrovi]
MKELRARRSKTRRRMTGLRGKLAEAERILEGKACVYATGSFGRCEANDFSDLDLFIVGKTRVDENGRGGESLLSRLDEICVKADLIQAIRELKIPDFDGDGRYLIHYSVDNLIKTLGRPQDDALNTFTARLLLLLESRPLLGSVLYEGVIDSVVAAYWGDYEDHKDDFKPAYLSNDILRL